MRDETIRRTIHPETRVLDDKKGIVQYVASDESLDSYKEVIRANGWRFNVFERNAPFVDSHQYGTIQHLVGKVIDFGLKDGRLEETVQWAIDVPENILANLGWRMTQAGYLKAVSVGFWPTRWISAGSADKQAWQAELTSAGLPLDSPVRTVYQEQEQIELSAVIIGANPNALAKSYKAGILKDTELDFISTEQSKRNAVVSVTLGQDTAAPTGQALDYFWREFEKSMKGV